MRERNWLETVVLCLFRALGIGLGVGVVLVVVLTVILSKSCVPEEDCMATVGGISYGLLAGTGVAVIAVIVLSVRHHITVFGVGVAISLMVFVGPGVLLNPDDPALYALLAAIVFVACTILSRWTDREAAAGEYGPRK